MNSNSYTAARTTLRALSRTRPSLPSSHKLAATLTSTRCLHSANASPLLPSRTPRRATVPPSLPSTFLQPTARRSIFIQTEPTPNPDALKFKPNHRILPEKLSTPFLEYMTPRSTLAPPHPSPLAAQLMNVDGVTSVFFGIDYITVTKDSSTQWAHVKPEVFSLITEAVNSGAPMVNTSEAKAGGESAEAEQDSLAYDENDSETVSMIKELLETRIRPAIQEDGGDIEFRGFDNGMVLLKLRGACRTCDSSTVTLKNGIEAMMQHYIPEVQGVEQVQDPEEEIAMKEFARFEEKLAQQKGKDAVAGTVGKGSLDTAEG